MKSEIKKLDTTVQDNTMTSLRNALMKSIIDIRNGNMNAQDGIAIAKLGNTVVETYKTEIEAVRTANSLKDRNVSYRNALKCIQPDIKETNIEQEIQCKIQ